MQVPAYKQSQEVFRKDYAYLSSTSKTFCKHAQKFVEKVVSRFKLNKNSFVVEIASNDGYLLEHVKKKNIPCLGVEPTNLAASIAQEKNINTLIKFFSYKTANEILQKYKKSSLIIANNVLPHVPDINDFLKGIAFILDDDGIVSIEFQHLLSLIKHGYWDTIYHEHYSYLSLDFMLKAAKKFNLEVFDVEIIPTHGGSLRVFLKHILSKREINFKKINTLLENENKYGCKLPKTFLKLQDRALKAKLDLIKLLISAKNKKQKVIAYGAAAKGNTLLNYAGIKSDLISNIIDKAKSKQGSYLPGSHIFISDLSLIKKLKPDIIIILAWNIKEEILKDLAEFKNINFYVAIPRLTRVENFE